MTKSIVFILTTLKSRHKASIKALLLFLVLFLCYKCQSGKKVADFKTIKHNIDSLVIIPSFIDIIAIGLNDSLIKDTVINNELSDTISSKIQTLLHKKYAIETIKGHNQISNEISSDLNELFLRLDYSKSTISNIEIPNSIIETANSAKQRYCIITFYGGAYKTRERERHDNLRMLTTGLAVAILTNGNYYLTSSDPSISIMRVVLFDKIKKRVLFYKVYVLDKNDPTNISTINHFVLMNFQSIYYK